MPLEIKELNIRINITPTEESPGVSQHAVQGTGSQGDKVIEACVEQILEVLKSKKER